MLKSKTANLLPIACHQLRFNRSDRIPTRNLCFQLSSQKEMACTPDVFKLSAQSRRSLFFLNTEIGTQLYHIVLVWSHVLSHCTYTRSMIYIRWRPTIKALTHLWASLVQASPFWRGAVLREATGSWSSNADHTSGGDGLEWAWRYLGRSNGSVHVVRHGILYADDKEWYFKG